MESARSAMGKGLSATLGALLMLAHAPAAAQPSRISIAINGGQQMQSVGITDNVVFTEFAEQGDFDSSYPDANGPLFDVTGRVRLVGNLAVGTGVSMASQRGNAHLTARLPYPFRFSRHRVVEGRSAALQRQELTVNVHAAWIVPLAASADVTLFGGPTFVSLKQDLVDRVEYDHAYPYLVASYTGAAHSQRSESAVGFVAGADVAYYFSRVAGVGGTVQFNRAWIALSSADGGIVEVDTGGLQATAGLRIRF
ncbi:MAG: hypothetical protein F4W89_04315 [Acidobacteria bacterium]|nr:hypothetical protein [Acidobacteriota bacterium]